MIKVSDENCRNGVLTINGQGLEHRIKQNETSGSWKVLICSQTGTFSVQIRRDIKRPCKGGESEVQDSMILIVKHVVGFRERCKESRTRRNPKRGFMWPMAVYKWALSKKGRLRKRPVWNQKSFWASGKVKSRWGESKRRCKGLGRMLWCIDKAQEYTGSTNWFGSF